MVEELSNKIKTNICKEYLETNVSIEKLGLKYHLGKKKIKDILFENNITIKNKGGQKLKKQYTILDYKIEKYPKENGYYYIAKDKNSDFSTNDYMNKSGVLTSYIKKNYNVKIPNLHYRRQYYMETGNYWWEQYFDIIKKENNQLKKCPYCDWTTIDINNNSGAFETHLLKIHNITKLDYLQNHPEDKDYFKTANTVKQRQIDDNTDNYVICKICGKKLARIDSHHLRTHNITKQEYITLYPNDSLLSINYKNLATQQAKELNNNQKFHKLSKPEKEITEFIKSFNLEIKSDRKILNGLEIDIYIPSLKIGFEFNGCLWHSEKYGKDKNYHLNKTLKCSEQGIQLYHIFEDEYHYNKKALFNKIQNIIKCNNSIKIRSNKCIIQEITKKESDKFLEEYHIQGKTNSTIYLGAFYENELVAVMLFLKEKQNNWNLNRFATSDKYYIYGISGKMFKYFKKNYVYNVIKSFADRRWTNNMHDNLYTKLGFQLTKILPPDYRYFNSKVDRYKRFHKFLFRKQILYKKYNLPLIMTESEMTEKLGYTKIYDCGLLKYEYKKETLN